MTDQGNQDNNAANNQQSKPEANSDLANTQDKDEQSAFTDYYLGS